MPYLKSGWELPAGCWGSIGKHKKQCQVADDGNKFCFEFKEDINNVHADKSSKSEFKFNRQERGVPKYVSDFMDYDKTTKDCDMYCGEVDEMVAIDKPSIVIGSDYGPVTNSIVSYTDLDDMCATCE